MWVLLMIPEGSRFIVGIGLFANHGADSLGHGIPDLLLCPLALLLCLLLFSPPFFAFVCCPP